MASAARPSPWSKAGTTVPVLLLVLLGTVAACSLPRIEGRDQTGTDDGPVERDAGPDGPPAADQRTDPDRERDQGPDLIGDARPDAPDLPTGITVQGTSTAGPLVGVSAVTLATPFGTRPGDMMWIALYVDLETSVVTAPEGWTVDASVVTATNSTGWWYRKFAVENEAERHEFVLNQPADAGAVLVAYRGVLLDSVPEAAATVAGETGQPEVVIPSLVTRSPGARVLVMVNSDHSMEEPPPELTPVGDADHALVFDRTVAEPGEAGPIRFGCNECPRVTLHAVALTPLSAP